MIRRLYTYSTPCVNPYRNLALEEFLLRRGPEESCVLYLWQNQRTVVIGRNQRAENECDIPALEGDGGHLARRLSGGGAVYHDLGNLNFTFLLPSADFHQGRQTQVILQAVRAVGIQGEKNGRNDLTAAGRKFSGHAYYHSGGRSYHHGTLMVAVDPAPLERYLHVSPLKWRGRGVSSVRSRVVNLRDLCPALTIPQLKDALQAALGQVYGLSVEPFPEEWLDRPAIETLEARYASPRWKYGEPSALEHSREDRFPWGTVRVDFTLREGVIVQAALWSDGLEADYLHALPTLLRGTPLRREDLARRLAQDRPELEEIASDIAGLMAESEENG